MIKSRRSERVVLHRHQELTGIELLDIDPCSGSWPRFCNDYELLIPETFSGAIWYRRQIYELTPARPFLAGPGGIVRVVETLHPGALSVLSLSTELVAQLRGSALRCAVAKSPLAGLAQERSMANAACVLRRMRGEEAVQPLRALLAALLDSLPIDGVDAARPGEWLPHGPPDQPLSSREPTDASPRRNDLSRSQADRRFVYRNGLPPHAYQLCRRIARSRQLLRAGMSLSQVASTQGFADQSHFTRHFRRWVGLTPRQYAQGMRHAALNPHSPSAGAT